MSSPFYIMAATAVAVESASNVNVPLAWVLAIIGSLATVVTVLAKMIFSIMNQRLEEMGKMLERQQKRIDKLQRGCGVSGCAWKLPGED